MLWAQEANTPVGITATLVLAFTSLLALMGWLIKHLLTTTVPALTTTFQQSLAAVIQDTGKLREQFDDRQTALLRHCEEEANRERQAGERRYEAAILELRAMQQSLVDHGQIMRTLLHITQQRTRQADVVESMEDPLWSKSLAGIVTSWNRAAERLLGWRRTEMVGRSVYEIVPPDLHGQERETLERVSHGEPVTQYRTARIHKDGRRIELTVTVSPVADPTGKVVGISSIGREC